MVSAVVGWGMAVTDPEIEALAERVAQEERIRSSIQAKLAPAPTSRGLPEPVKWIIVSLIIPLLGLAYQSIKDSWDASAQIEKVDREVVTAVLPLMSEERDPYKRRLGMRILSVYTERRAADSFVRRLYLTLEADFSQQAGGGNTTEVRREAAIALEGTAPDRPDAGVEPVQVRPPAPAVLQSAEAAVPSRIYIQVYSEAQRTEAEIIRNELRGRGVPVPEIEDVSRRLRGAAPDPLYQVRYFNDRDIGAARWTATLLGQIQDRNWTVLRVRVRTQVPSGQLEIWWPTP